MHLKKISNNEEFDLINLFLKIWKEKKSILIISLIFFLFSIIYSYSLTNIYKASSTFYPHYQDVENNSIKSLAGLAGVNIDLGNTSDIPTSLYPNLVTSTPFKSKILNQKINHNNSNVFYKDYLLNLAEKKSLISLIIKYTIKLPFTLISYISKEEDKNNISSTNENYFTLSKMQYQLHENLNNIISLVVNEKDGYITLTISDNSPEVAAQIAKKAEEILQESIINYKIKNIKSLYDFTIKQLESSKKKFYKLQDSLANFNDNNKNIKSDIFLNKRNRIQKEYDIASTIYDELAITKEKNAIEVQKNTPIFTIINPVVLPNEIDSPKRLFIIVFLTFLGIIFSISWVLIKDAIKTKMK